MALWVCLDCTTNYSVGALSCPQCGSMRYAEYGSEEAEMPKITVHGGPTDASVSGVPADPAAEATDDSALVDQIPEEGSAEDDSVDYSEWSYGELQAELKERGLPATGSRNELEQRLAESEPAGDG